jgi:hypothetical protein
MRSLNPCLRCAGRYDTKDRAACLRCVDRVLYWQIQHDRLFEAEPSYDVFFVEHEKIEKDAEPTDAEWLKIKY